MFPLFSLSSTLTRIMLKQTVTECDTSELLPEGVIIHNFPTLLPSLLVQKGKKTNKPTNQPGLL